MSPEGCGPGAPLDRPGRARAGLGVCLGIAHEVGEGLGVEVAGRHAAEVAPDAHGGAGADLRADLLVGAVEAAHGRK